MSFAGDGLDVAAGIVFQFLFHRVVNLLLTTGPATNRYRVRRPDIGGRCHRGNIRGEGDKTTGTASAGTRRGHVDNGRHRRRQHVLDDDLG